MLRVAQNYTVCVFLAFYLLITGVHSTMNFVVQPTNRSVVEGWTTVLNCTIANRVGMVQWMKGGFGLGVDRSLPGFDRYSVIGVEQQGAIGEFNLQIQDVTIDDEDWYECQVQGSATYPRGMRSQRAFLSVVVHPERPSIVGAPTIPVVLHTPTNITCRADRGKPGAHITWHLDGQRLTYGVSSQVQPRGKYLDTIGVLTFNATLADAAKKMECQAITEFMESPFRTFATLDVQFAPDLRMTINVTGRNLREHDYIQFQCMGRANPASVIWSWYRNDHPIKDATSNTFHIEAVSPEYNKNKISCEATNTVGSSRVDTVLNIEYGARIQGITEVVGADVGHPAELSCEADGNPEPSVIWRRKDRTTYAHRTLSTKKVFQLDRVSSQDFGWYVCTATVIGFPDTSREAMLLKNDRPNMRSEKQQMATEGERGKLECLTNSIPKPKSITWSKGGKEINYAMSGRFSKEDKDILYGARSVLHIQSVHSEDFGIYNCTVENDYGVAFDQIELVEKHVLPITYIIISIIGGVAVIFVIALVCVLYRRCKKDDQGSYADTDSSSDKKREKTDSPNTLMGQLRQDYNKDVYRFSADYDDMPYKEQQAKGNNNGYGYIEPYEAYSDNQIYDGEYVHRGDDLIPERLDPAYNTGTAYSMSSFRRSSHDSTPPPTMTRLTSLHMSDSKLATDV
ncbi:hypothetical protein BsWGS_28675 [Bradybaena similaris]